MGKPKKETPENPALLESEPATDVPVVVEQTDGVPSEASNADDPAIDFDDVDVGETIADTVADPPEPRATAPIAARVAVLHERYGKAWEAVLRGLLDAKRAFEAIRDDAKVELASDREIGDVHVVLPLLELVAMQGGHIPHLDYEHFALPDRFLDVVARIDRWIAQQAPNDEHAQAFARRIEKLRELPNVHALMDHERKGGK